MFVKITNPTSAPIPKHPLGKHFELQKLASKAAAFHQNILKTPEGRAREEARLKEITSEAKINSPLSLSMR